MEVVKSFVGRFVFTCLICLLVTSCSSTQKDKFIKAIKSGEAKENARQVSEQIAHEKVQEYTENPQQIVKDFKDIRALFDQLRNKVESIWGKKDGDVPSKEKYVKYTDDYKAKATVDFKKGLVRVETIETNKTKQSLKQAIVTTLLTTDDPNATDIFSDKQPEFNGKPYLLGQVLDQDGKAIQYEWRANRFADYLVANKVKSQQAGKHTSTYVDIPLVDQHNELRKQKYSEYVLAAASKYQVSPSLIYAIIETESSFNPFAVSPANAYGLMQVVPRTAGKDVYTRIKKRQDQPTKDVLFNPEQNIDIGTAYLHILDDIYLKKLNDALSREYAVISAYNGGAGNVFKTFSSKRSDAPNVINRLNSEQVYSKLTKNHPKSESRRYLEKVTKYREQYR